jgi:hypothetical protein
LGADELVGGEEACFGEVSEEGDGEMAIKIRDQTLEDERA